MRMLIRNLPADTAYLVQLRTKLNDQVSEWSQMFEFRTAKDEMPPAPVQNLSGVMSEGNLSLAWEPPTTNADGTELFDLKDFKVSIGPVPADANWPIYTEFVEGPRADFTKEMNIAAFGTYRTGLTISVQARDIVGNLSDPVTITKVKAAPNPVTSLVWTAVGTSFSAAWTPPTTNVDGSAFTDPNGFDVKIIYASTNIRTYSTSVPNFDYSYEQNKADFGGVPGTAKSPLTIEVRARDSVGQLSSAVSQAASNPVPAAPTGLSATVLQSAISLKWNKSTEDDVVNYQVWQGATSGDVGTLVAEPVTNSYLHETVAYSTDHYFYVKAVDVMGGASPASTRTGALRPTSPFQVDTTPPNTPTAVTSTWVPNTSDPSGASGDIRVTWTASTSNDVRNYVVAYSTDNTNWSYMNSDGSPATIKNQRAGATYYVKVKAVDASANSSAYVSATNLTTVIDSTAPAAVTGVSASGGLQTLTVFWTENTEIDVKNGAGTYEVQVDTANTFNTGNLKTVKTSATVLGFSNLTTNTTYYVRVRAIDSSGNAGPYSAIVSAAVGNATTSLSDGSAPASSPTPTVNPLYQALEIKWTAVTNNDPVTYEVHVSTSSGFTPSAGTKAGEVSGTSFIVKTLPGTSTALAYGTTYYVRLIAKDRDGSAAVGTQASGVPSQVDNGDIAANAVRANHIQAGTITTSHITVNTLNGDRIQTNTLNADRIVSLSITAAQIQAGTITGDKINVNDLFSKNATVSGSLTMGATDGGAGAIQSFDYNAGTSKGWKIDANGITIYEGTISSAALNIGTIQSGLTSIDGSIIKTGSIISTAFSPVGDTTQPAWSLNTAGNMQIGDGLVRGKLVVGSSNNTGVQVASSNYGGTGSQWAIKGDGTIDLIGGAVTGGVPGASSLQITSTGITAKDSGGNTRVSIQNTGTFSLATTNGGVVFDDNGLRLYSGATLKVDLNRNGNASFTGTVTAAAGEIAGWTIAPGNLSKNSLVLDSTTGAIYSGSGGSTVGLRGGYGFWAGSINQWDSNVPFSVSTTGYLTSRNGYIGGWTIGPTSLSGSGTLSGGTVSGTNIRTSLGNQRIQLTAGTDTISWYNSSGTETAFIQGNSYSSGYMRIYSGNFILLDTPSYGKVYVNNGFHVYGGVDVGGTLQASGDVWGANGRFASGTVYGYTGDFGGQLYGWGGVYDAGNRVYSAANPHGHGSNYWGGFLRMADYIWSDTYLKAGTGIYSDGHLMVHNGGSPVVFYNGGNSRFGCASGSAIYLQRQDGGAYASVFGGAYTNSSSRSVKKNVKALEKKTNGKGRGSVKKLRPVQFEYDPEFYTDPVPNKTRLGLIAEEVEELYPEAINYDENGKPGIDFTAITTALLLTVQEQQDDIDELRAMVQALKK